MGYTHYWEQKRHFTIAEWKVICDDVATILKEATAQGIALADGLGEPGTSPVITKKDIRFNGVGDDSHETFYIERRIRKPDYEGRTPGFDFCKTAQKPYDPVVVAVLCYLATITRKDDPKTGEPIFGTEAYSVSSDGDCSEWLSGLDLARKALPRVANQLDLPMQMLEAARWCAPWVNNKADGYEVHFCVDGHGYVLMGQQSYCFESHRALAQFLEKTKLATFAKGGSTGWGSYGKVEENIWNAMGSFDEARHARIAKAQAKVLASLFPVDPACAKQPPAYVRPGQMPDNSGREFCYSVEDLLNLGA